MIGDMVQVMWAGIMREWSLWGVKMTKGCTGVHDVDWLSTQNASMAMCLLIRC